MCMMKNSGEKEACEVAKNLKAAAEVKRLAQLPPGLQRIVRQRQEALSHTNEVVVEYGSQGKK